MAGIYTTAGVTIAEGPLVPDFQNLSLNKISMNAAGSVLFFADFTTGSGLYIGPDPYAANGVGKLIAIGDALFGSTVTQLFVGTGALNDAGQVAFYCELASRNRGIAVVPEPETDAMLLTSFAVIGAMVRRRSCALPVGFPAESGVATEFILGRESSSYSLGSERRGTTDCLVPKLRKA